MLDAVGRSPPSAEAAGNELALLRCEKNRETVVLAGVVYGDVKPPMSHHQMQLFQFTATRRTVGLAVLLHLQLKNWLFVVPQ